jgi:hypothetical protein
MLQRNDGKNIAILFYARAWALGVSFVFVLAICSTGLITKAFAAAKIPPRPAENITGPISLENLKPFKTLRVIRTNVANHAFEELTIQDKLATLKRSNGLSKTLVLEEGVFQTYEQNIRALQTYEPKTVKPQDGVKVEMAVKTADGESRFDVDPAGRAQTIYADLMNLRNKVLSSGK